MVSSGYQKLKCDGGPRATRTPNLLIRSQMLYPIELWDPLKTLAQKKASAKADRQ
jgi:hypothetical protein